MSEGNMVLIPQPKLFNLEKTARDYAELLKLLSEHAEKLPDEIKKKLNIKEKK